MFSDHDYMKTVLDLSRHGLGHVAPNPSVGCLIVKEGVIVGRGVTAPSGRPHAEAMALAQAGEAARGATVYVTLEPCAVPGRGPACSDLLVEAGVERVVFACIDPHPAVNGAGAKKMRAAGIEVVAGILEEEAQAMHRGFFSKVLHNRPFVTLKCAISANNKIADAPGQRTQISGEAAQRYLHLLRSQHDAVMVGKTTWEVDEPRLTTRIPGYDHEAQKIVLDRDVPAALQDLSDRGVTRLLVEGGAKVHASFLECGLYDEVHLLRSPHMLSEEGVEAADFARYIGMQPREARPLGEDVLEIYERKE